MADFQYMTYNFERKFKNGNNKNDVATVEYDFASYCNDIRIKHLGYREFVHYLMGVIPMQMHILSSYLYIDRMGRLCKTPSVIGNSSKYVGGFWDVTCYLTSIYGQQKSIEKVCSFADFVNAGGIVIMGNNYFFNGYQLLSWYVS